MAATSKVLTAPKDVRCAIYTRKSTEEGLNQEFNSLDAQREAGEAYILSQKHDGWTLVARAAAHERRPLVHLLITFYGNA